jgi:SAM-dependent methyltransferase
MGSADYFLASAEEQQRLELQARVWEPDTEALLDRIGVRAGLRCLDVGCGAMGVLGPLSRRVGRGGSIVGVDSDPKLLSAARAYVAREALANVELVEGDATLLDLAPESFDLVHERFVLPHLEDPGRFVRRMCDWTRPGGVVVLQEPDHASWNYYPHIAAWPRLLEVIEQTFALRGDINIGRRTFALLRGLRLDDVHVRAGVVALEHGHPYLRMPIVGINAMRARTVAAGIASDTELDDLIEAVEAGIGDPSTYVVTFTTVQVWGRKPRIPGSAAASFPS